jgi:hypothetical protein
METWSASLLNMLNRWVLSGLRADSGHLGSPGVIGEVSRLSARPVEFDRSMGDYKIKRIGGRINSRSILVDGLPSNGDHTGSRNRSRMEDDF